MPETTDTPDPSDGGQGTWRTFRRWLRRAFLVWAIFSTTWIATAFITRGVDPTLLADDSEVQVRSTSELLSLSPRGEAKPVSLLFICGSGVTAEAYVPLLHPLAEAGYAVTIVRLPWRFAPLDDHKDQALQRARSVLAAEPDLPWVVGGHSLGAALAARLARENPSALDGLVLIGTTHPKAASLRDFAAPTLKIVGDRDGVAPLAKAQANAELLPKTTHWVELKGANHSQFGHYGHQFLDGWATISRTEQQQRTREEIQRMLAQVAARIPPLR